MNEIQHFVVSDTIFSHSLLLLEHKSVSDIANLSNCIINSFVSTANGYQMQSIMWLLIHNQQEITELGEASE